MPSDTDEKLTEVIRDKFDVCANNQNDGFLVITTGESTTKIIEQKLTNKDRYLVVKKQQEWLPYPHRYGRIHIFKGVRIKMRLSPSKMKLR